LGSLNDKYSTIGLIINMRNLDSCGISAFERLWRSLEYECVYLYDLQTGPDAREGIGRWIDFYNHERPHSSLGDSTPMERYRHRMAA